MITRRAVQSDVEFLYNLRCEPEVRAASWNSLIIECDRHVVWFDELMDDPNRELYILEDGETQVGQVRYDTKDGGIAEVNVSISNQHYGKGYASEGLFESARTYFANNPAVKTIFAHIKPDNKGSLKAFNKAGYSNKGLVNYNGHECVEMTLNRP